MTHISVLSGGISVKLAIDIHHVGLKPNPLDLSSFSALTLLVGSFDP